MNGCVVNGVDLIHSNCFFVRNDVPDLRKLKLIATWGMTYRGELIVTWGMTYRGKSIVTSGMTYTGPRGVTN